jgi:hypothetical protein
MFTLARGLTDQGRIDAIESELRPAEEVEGSINADIAPGQAEVALPAWTEDEGPPKSRPSSTSRMVTSTSQRAASASPGTGLKTP